MLSFDRQMRFLIPLALFALSHSLIAASPPNIVFILADDLGWSDLGCYGSDLHETPNIDRLATEGVRFTQAYAASSVCSPTRASLMTGKSPARLNMTIWREAARERGNRRLLEPLTLDSLPISETTLAEELGKTGYYNVHIGKWHLGRAEGYPQPHGFDVNIGGTLWGAPQSFFYPYRGDRYFNFWRYVPDLEPGAPGDYLTDRLTDKALDTMATHAKKRPLFLNLWYHSVHTPIEGKPAVVAKYQEKIRLRSPKNHRNPHYAAMVESLDENVGRILEKLDTLGIAENTIVIFFSDNGGFVGSCKLNPGLPVTTNSPLRSGKGALYEGGIRVPLIIRWPGKVAQGKACATPVISSDLLPTLLELVNSPPVRSATPLQGRSIVPLLKEPTGGTLERDLFFHYPHYYPTTTPVSAIRSGDWKLLEYFEDSRTELYNLSKDVGETNNLVATEASTAERLLTALRQWRHDVNASLPEPNDQR